AHPRAGWGPGRARSWSLRASTTSGLPGGAGWLLAGLLQMFGQLLVERLQFVIGYARFRRHKQGPFLAPNSGVNFPATEIDFRLRPGIQCPNVLLVASELNQQRSHVVHVVLRDGNPNPPSPWRLARHLVLKAVLAGDQGNAFEIHPEGLPFCHRLNVPIEDLG